MSTFGNLQQVQLTKGKATGFPNIYSAMERNGSPKPHFETDDDRTYFLATLPVHSSLKEQAQAPALILLIIWVVGHARGASKETLKGLLEGEFICPYASGFSNPSGPKV